MFKSDLCIWWILRISFTSVIIFMSTHLNHFQLVHYHLSSAQPAIHSPLTGLCTLPSLWTWAILSWMASAFSISCFWEEIIWRDMEGDCVKVNTVKQTTVLMHSAALGKGTFLTIQNSSWFSNVVVWSNTGQKERYLYLLISNFLHFVISLHDILKTNFVLLVNYTQLHSYTDTVCWSC